MNRLSIIRLEQTSQGTIGVLLLWSFVHSFTLEPDEADPKRGHIPGGTPDTPLVYPVRRFHGIRWSDTYEIIVPGHTAVLFHPGNTEEDTTMCVLLGSSVGKLNEERAVLNSGASFRSFMSKMNNLPKAEIEVIDFYRG